ncbi:sentrin-specific protease 6 isoform X2 [Alosa sapidissima]|uniref:sentrin-specific protease 6 isoform X2 n=1 Tax=Alosa sapidissima TaxID=34773 RepID=UPI001C098F17|nr:sentrin-specific protease 6 isoform X2 [Alosa sapidissima]
MAMELSPPMSPTTTSFRNEPRPVKGRVNKLFSHVSQSMSLKPIHCDLVELPTTPRVTQGRQFHHTISLLPLQRKVERSDRTQQLHLKNTNSPLCTALFPSGDRSPQGVPDFGIFSSIPSFASKPSSSLLPSMAPTTDFKAALNSLPKFTSPYFSASESKITLPRKFRMRDELGDVAKKPSPKKRKIKLHLSAVTEPAFKKPELTNVCLDISSWRLGSLHSVTKCTVSVTHEQIEINQCVHVQSSELTSCELCLDQKLPVIFIQSTPAGSLRLRVQLNMSREKWAVWYDCGASASPTEKYIVLILENLPSAQQQNALEKILSDIGRANQLNEFPRKISLDEANNRLMAQDQVAQSLPASPQSPQFNVLDTDEEDLLDAGGNALTVIPTAIADSVHRLLVFPPPPAKGGIAVTNEDLCCLKEGEFLNDVIIDFYLKYLLLEKLKSEDAGRTHIFSTFFYKHLTQGRRRDGTNGKEPLKKRRHDRVKSWTRHVDLFEKDFLFVPINTSAHWFLAIVCFPGRCQPDAESQSPSNTLEDVRPQGPAQSDWLETSFFWRTGQDLSYSPNPLSLFYKPTNAATWPNKGSTGPADVFSFEDEEEQEMMSELLQYKTNVQKPCSTDQPCILIMDSLGCGRSSVVNILKEYLEEEWRVRKGIQCSFEVKGFSPSVPQQNNSSDCGIYLLQYVESFFESPLRSFEAPIDLNDWFPQPRVAKKRNEIRKLILKIQNQQQMAGKAEDG